MTHRFITMRFLLLFLVLVLLLDSGSVRKLAIETENQLFAETNDEADHYTRFALDFEDQPVASRSRQEEVPALSQVRSFCHHPGLLSDTGYPLYCIRAPPLHYFI